MMKNAEGRMNRAEESIHKEHSARTRMGGSHGKGSDVGNERKADVRGTQEGGSAAEAGGLRASLKHAVHELHSQHPHEHDDHGPHHGGMEHVRHKPLHGMKPGGGY